MDHRERVEACREVSQRLVRKYHHEIIATAVIGSVARREDLEHSDIDFQVLVKDGSRLSSHTFVLNNCLFAVSVRTEDDWRKELTEGGDHLPLAIGSLMNVLPAHDPTGAFARLKGLASNVPSEAWKRGAADGISSIFEDLGRLMNLYEKGDWDGFRMMTGSVAATMALTYANLTHQVLASEKGLTKVFENAEGPDSEGARAFRIAARLDNGDDSEVMESLRFLGDLLVRMATRQSSMPPVLRSARNYLPP